MIDVIVMAFDRQPVKLKCVHNEKNNTFMVAGEEKIWMGYPARYVFEFDEELFNKLTFAYKQNNRSELDSLWQKATKITEASR